MHKQTAGFSLVELMVVLVILGIITGIAVSSYRGQTVRANRSAVESYMKEVSGKEERYLLDNRQYALTMSLLGEAAPPTVSNNYTVTIEDDDTASPVPGYLITATPIGSQLKDDALCGVLTLNHRGTQTPAASGDTARCWN